MTGAHVARTIDVPVEHVDVSAYRIPTDTPHESDGTLVWDATTLVLVEAARRRHDRIGVHLRRYGDGGSDSRYARRCRYWPGRDGHRAHLDRDRRAHPQSRASGHRRNGHLGRRCGALGSQSTHPRCATGYAARARAGRRADLRQRRIHIVFDPTAPNDNWPIGSKRGSRGSR